MLAAFLSVPVMAATIIVSPVAPPGTNFTSIQAAINGASPGDTIHVYAGTYPEAIDVNKTLTIKGIGGTPVLGNPGNDASVQTSANGIILENLQITTGSRWDVNIGGNNLTLQSLNMTGHSPVNPDDPVINGSRLNGLTIQGCLLESDGYNGIMLNNTANLTIKDNTLENNISIIAYYTGKGTQYSNINVINNTLQGGLINVYSPLSGLITYPDVQNILVDNNTITDPTQGGILIGGYLEEGYHFKNATITHNTVTGAQSSVINIHILAISGGVLQDNLVSESNDGADGINLLDLNEFTIQGNRVENCTGSSTDGTVGFSLDSLTNSVVSNNTVTNVLPYSFFYAPGLHLLPNLTLDATNTADGKPVLYYEGKNGVTINGQQPAMVILMSCSNMKITNSMIENTGIGAGIYNCTGTTVSGTRFLTLLYGMMLIKSTSSVIKENTFTGSSFGIGVGDNTNALISGNTFSGYSNSGILVHSGKSNNVTITENTFTGSMPGKEQAIATFEVTGNGTTITHNKMNKNSRGFLIYFTNNLTVLDNTMADGGIGINLNAAQDNVFSNNTILNGEGEYTGVYMYSNTSIGGGLCAGNQFSNNYIQSDIPVFINYGGEDPNTAMDFGPIWGPGIQAVTILPSADEPDAVNIWNVTKTSGTNIVNGPYHGGNYWAMANGSGWSQIHPDRGDGFVNAPFVYDGNNTDYLPLHTVITPTPTISPIPIPTNPSGPSGDGSSSNTLGRMSSYIVTSPGVQTGGAMTFTINQSVTTNSPGAFITVVLVPSQTIGTTILTVVDANTIDTSQLKGRQIAYIASIEPVGVNPSVISQSTIIFAVSGSWLSQHGLTPDNIVLLRDHDGQWSELTTAFDYQEGNTYYFTATTPGFSYYAITTRLNATTDVTTTPGTISDPASSIGSSGAKTPVVTTSHFAATPMPTQTTTIPATGTGPARSSGIPVSTIVIGIAGITIIAIAGFLVRRWWIHRQNPALFRDYD